MPLLTQKLPFLVSKALWLQRNESVSLKPSLGSESTLEKADCQDAESVIRWAAFGPPGVDG